jgi:uncharacterized protein DUF3303
MLFAVKYSPIGSRTEEDRRQLRRIFLAWQPPAGVEVRAHYHYVSGGGLAVADTESASLLFESLQPFKPLLAFDVEPVINVIEALAIAMGVDEWAGSVLASWDARDKP